MSKLKVATASFAVGQNKLWAVHNPSAARSNRYVCTTPGKPTAPENAVCVDCPMHLACLYGKGQLELWWRVNNVIARPRQGDKILLIKAHREKTGASLRDSKKFIEQEYDASPEGQYFVIPNDCPRFGVKAKFWEEVAGDVFGEPYYGANS